MSVASSRGQTPEHRAGSDPSRTPVSRTGSDPYARGLTPTRLPVGKAIGLTLVEVLVAMAILVTVSAASMLMFRGITRAWRTGAIRTEQYQQARLLFDLFTREISASIANAHYPLIGVPTSSTVKLHPESAFDELFFVGTLPGRIGLVERGYWITADGQFMCHDEEPADGDPATGTNELCGREVSQFTVTYFDGSAWLTEWDGRAGMAQSGTLPRAIHMTLAIGRERSEQFETVIHVPTS